MHQLPRLIRPVFATCRRVPRTPSTRCQWRFQGERSQYRYSSTTSSAMTPVFSAGENESQLAAEVKALVGEGRWQLDDQNMAIEKEFYFPNYTKCLDFVQTVGIRSKSKSHHSIMTVEFGSVRIQWTTHNPRGLSSKDSFMARFCDEQASIIGAVEKASGAKCSPSKSRKNGS